MKVDFNDKLVGGFNYEFVRGVSTESAGAAELGECFETMSRVRNSDFESWIEHWSATADRVAAFAERRLKAGDQPSARNAFLRASNYYRIAVFYVAHTDPRHTTLWKRSRECFHQMIPLLDRRVECIDVDFEGAKLPAYFVSAGEGVRPTLIALGGFDSTMEEVYGWVGTTAGDYGWHCLIFEGPGQWGALKANPGLVFRPDYEKPMNAVVDYLLTRPDVDPNKLALIGYSAGGYFAPRAASGEPRIKACIANTLVVDCGEAARAGLKGMTNPWLIDTAFGLIMKRSAAARWGFSTLNGASVSAGRTNGQVHTHPSRSKDWKTDSRVPCCSCSARTISRALRRPHRESSWGCWSSYLPCVASDPFTCSRGKRVPPAIARWVD